LAALLAACAGCSTIIYDDVEEIAGTPLGDGWLRVAVPSGPPLSVELPEGSLYEFSYHHFDDSVVRKRHPGYRIRIVKIADGYPIPALNVMFLWLEPEMRLLSSQELEGLDRSVESPDAVSRIFLEKLWYTRRVINQALERSMGPQEDPHFVDHGFRQIGGRPARCFAFLPQYFWYDENCLVAVPPSRGLIIVGTFHPEGMMREKTTVWPRLLESIRFD
jgi:hypothetical protein